MPKPVKWYSKEYPTYKRCGKCHEKASYCPAKEATCSKCHRKDHFTSQCFSKSVAAKESEVSKVTYLFPMTMGKESRWSSTIHVGEYEVDFKLDTGAEATVITEETYKRINQPTLQPSSTPLYGQTSINLSVLGQFTH